MFLGQKKILLNKETIIQEGQALVRLVCRDLFGNENDDNASEDKSASDKAESVRFYRTRDWNTICRIAEIQNVESILYQ